MCLASVLLGMLSDRYGRRKPIIITLVLMVAVNSFMAFSVTLPTILIGRVLVGFLPTVVLLKTYMGEITDHTNQHQGFKVLGLSAAFSGITAPLVGGWFSNPTESWGLSGGFWATYPYLIPFFTCALMSIVANCVVYFWLPESQKWLQRSKTAEQEKQMQDLIALEGSDEAIAPTFIAKPTATEAILLKMFPPYIRTLRVAIGVGMYVLALFVDMVFDSFFAVFCQAQPENGGVGIGLEAVGTLLSVEGVFKLLWVYFVYAKIAERWGCRRILVICCITWGSVLLLMPFVSLAAAAGVSEFGIYCMLIILLAVRATIAVTIGLVAYVLIANCCDHSVLAQVYGWAATFTALFKSGGLLLAGAVWTYAIAGMLFWFVGLLSIATGIAAFWIPPEMDVPVAYAQQQMRGQMSGYKEVKQLPEFSNSGLKGRSQTGLGSRSRDVSNSGYDHYDHYDNYDSSL